MWRMTWQAKCAGPTLPAAGGVDASAPESSPQALKESRLEVEAALCERALLPPSMDCQILLATLP